MLSNKKILILLSLFFLTLIISSCSPKVEDILTSDNTWTVIENNNTTNIETELEQTDSSIKMQKCEYVDQNWEKSQIFILWNVVKTESIDMTSNVKKYWLSKDDKYYIRSENSKKWFAIDLIQMSYGEYLWSDWTTKNVNSTATLIEKFTIWNDTCKEEEKSDFIFEMPSDIIF